MRRSEPRLLQTALQDRDLLALHVDAHDPERVDFAPRLGSDLESRV